jgi:hypothetical protein
MAMISSSRLPIPLFSWLVLLLSFFLSGCMVPVNYLGDSYPPKPNIDVFYDEADVTREYEVIGRMANSADSFIEVDLLKNGMVEEARKRGADAIIFLDMEMVGNTEDDDVVGIKSIAVRYK